MDNKMIQSILQNALHEKIPASQIDLWSGVKADRRVKYLLDGTQKETRNISKSLHILRLAFIGMLALLIITFSTPQGRALADSIFKFFVQTENSAFQLQSSQIVENESELYSATSIPPVPVISVAEAEAQVGFDVLELSFIPTGLNYLGARVYGNTISISYETQDHGGHLSIDQSLDGYNQSDWDRVPVDAVIPVKIGDLDAEFVQGTFVVYPNQTVATWNPDASILRLRWEKDGIWFQISKYGDVETIKYIDQNELIAIAKSLLQNQ